MYLAGYSTLHGVVNSSGNSLQVARCTKIINANTEDAKYMINVKQIAKFVVSLGDKVAPTDIEEGMRVGVDRTKYQIQVCTSTGTAALTQFHLINLSQCNSVLEMLDVHQAMSITMRLSHACPPGPLVAGSIPSTSANIVSIS